MMGKNILFSTTYTDSFLEFRGPLVSKFIHSGYKVFLASPKTTLQYESLLKDHHVIHLPITVDRNKQSFMSDVVYLIQIIRIMLKYNFNIVVSYFAKSVVYTTVISFFFGVPTKVCLLEGLGYFFTKKNKSNPPPTSYLIHILYKISLFFADKVVFLNDDDRSLFVQKKLVKPSKSYVLGPIGVDLSTVVVSQELPVNPLSFTFAGRFVYNKGIVEFVEAALIASSALKNVIFNIAGSHDNGIDSVPLELVDYWKNNSPINFLGFVNSISLFMNTSVIVLPSYREGFSRIIQESMASGIPVIASDVPGCRQAINPYHNGLLVRPYSVTDLVEAFTFFSNNRDLIPSMSRNARFYAEANFCAQKQSELLYEYILKK